jgi:hypothetical protein
MGVKGWKGPGGGNRTCLVPLHSFSRWSAWWALPPRSRAKNGGVYYTHRKCNGSKNLRHHEHLTNICFMHLPQSTQTLAIQRTDYVDQFSDRYPQDRLSFHILAIYLSVSVFQCYTGYWFSVAFRHSCPFTASSGVKCFCFIILSTSFRVFLFFFLPATRSLFA